MAGEINIPINGDASKFIRETGDAEQALEKVSDALDDMARDSKKGADKAEKAVDDLADSFDEARRAVKKLDDATDDVGKNTRTNMRDAGDNVRKFGDQTEEVSGELKQNLGETFSSFRGDLEDLPQIAQDVFGGLAGSVGGLVPAFGLAAGAAGIGLLIAAFQGLAEEEEARKERVGEWASAYIEASGRIKDSVASLAAVEDIYTDSEKYDKAAQAAKDWGVDVSTAVNAMAGDSTALAIAQESLTDKTEKLNKALETTQVNADGTTQGFADIQAEVSRGADTLSNITGEMAEGAQRAQDYARSLFDLAQSTGTATGEVDGLGNQIMALPDGTEVVIDAETKTAYSNVQTLENKINGVQGKTVGVGVDTSGANNNLNNWISQNNGRTIKIYGKYVSPVGGQIP